MIMVTTYATVVSDPDLPTKGWGKIEQGKLWSKAIQCHNAMKFMWA